MVMYILLVVLLSITLTHSFPQWTPSRPVRPRLGAPFGDRRNQTRFTPGPNPPLLDRPIHHVDLGKDWLHTTHQHRTVRDRGNPCAGEVQSRSDCQTHWARRGGVGRSLARSGLGARGTFPRFWMESVVGLGLAVEHS